MKTFKAILGLLAVLIVGSQTFRHIYVRWVENRGSVLDQFEETKKSIAAAKSIEELLELYKESKARVEEADAARAGDEDFERSYSKWENEPYRSEAELKSAIREWESHSKELVELHYFWWIGLSLALLGGVFYLRSNQWLGIAVILLGYAEMIWATSPSYQAFGYPLEFERLLTLKAVYSMGSLVLIFVGWRAAVVAAKNTIAG